MADELFIPPPTRGMYSDNILVPPTEGFAQLLRNVSIGSGSIRFRPGTAHEGGVASPLTGHEVSWHGNSTWLWTDGRFRDSVANTIYASALTSRPVYEGRFRDRIYLSFPGQATAAYTGSTWGAFPFTLATLSSSEIAGSVSYRGRAYFWGSDASAANAQFIEYGGLDSVSGNTTALAINRFMRNQTILACKTFTVEQGLTTGEVFVVYGNQGLVLVFTGDDPGATNWFLAGVYQMSNPISKHGFVEVQGDIMVMSREYIYSMRALFSGGTQAAQENALTNPISLLYRGAIDTFLTDYETFPPFAFYMPQENALVFSVGKASNIMWVGDQAEWGDGWDYRQLQFVYYRQHKAWVVWDVPQLKWPVREDAFGQLYYYVNNLQASFNYGGLQDIQTGYDVVYRYDALETVDTALFDSFSVGGQTNYRKSLPHEVVWRSTISMRPEHRNARVSTVTPIIRNEDRSPGIAKAGVIGSGADYTKDLRNGAYIQDTSVDSEMCAYGDAFENEDASSLTGIKAPEIEAGLDAETFHISLRFNEMGTPAQDTDDPTVDVFGIVVNYVPEAA